MIEMYADNVGTSVDSLTPPLILSLVKTIDHESRVVYAGQRNDLWVFQRIPGELFQLYSCTQCGELTSDAMATTLNILLDYVPAGDSSTAVSFRAWRAKQVSSSLPIL